MSSSDSNKPLNNPLTKLGLPSPLLLGSASFTRKLILQEMNIPFQIFVKSIDESAIGDRSSGTLESAKTLVSTLAHAKADRLLQALQNQELDIPIDTNLPTDSNKQGVLILTADQVVTHNNTILEKPNSTAQAKTFVRNYAYSPASTVGAVVLTHYPSLLQVSGIHVATVAFSPSIAYNMKNDQDETVQEGEGEDLVDEMRKEGAPILSCAGGLMIEHPLVQRHVQTMEGGMDSIMGLSKETVLGLLREMKDKLG